MLVGPTRVSVKFDVAGCLVGNPMWVLDLYFRLRQNSKESAPIFCLRLQAQPCSLETGWARGLALSSSLSV